MSINHSFRDLRQQAGDTIVEVLVVLAVLGLAISISYATANRSILDARQAQENSQATEYVQAQIENLRAYASYGPSSSDYIFKPASFCINSGGGVSSGSCPYGVSTSFSYGISDTYSSSSASPPGGTFTVV